MPRICLSRGVQCFRQRIIIVRRMIIPIGKLQRAKYMSNLVLQRFVPRNIRICIRWTVDHEIELEYHLDAGLKQWEAVGDQSCGLMGTWKASIAASRYPCLSGNSTVLWAA